MLKSVKIFKFSLCLRTDLFIGVKLFWFSSKPIECATIAKKVNFYHKNFFLASFFYFIAIFPEVFIFLSLKLL
jgi:hypothetical protein